MDIAHQFAKIVGHSSMNYCKDDVDKASIPKLGGNKIV